MSNIHLKLESNVVSPAVEMSSKAFQEGTYLGSSLYYDGDIPRLLLDMSSPFMAGKAHGYLCGSAINVICSHVFSKIEKPEEAVLEKMLSKVEREISYDGEEYLQEMAGILEGYQEWLNERSGSSSAFILRKEDLLLLQILPDYFGLTNIRTRPVACTTIVEKEGPHGSLLVRNLDHDSFGCLGTYSLIIERKNGQDQKRTISIGMPCLIGILTGSNEEGLVVAMNTCPDPYLKNTISGLPAAMYCRKALELWNTVQELHSYALRDRPMVAFHLTSADVTGSAIAHEFFGIEQVRKMKDLHLVTLNNHYSSGLPVDETEDDAARREAIERFFEMRNDRPLEEVLESPPVNKDHTIHRIVIQLTTKEISVAFADHQAGNKPLQRIQNSY